MHRRSYAARSRSRQGFTLVELAFAVAVLVVAVSGLLGALVGSTALGRVARESSIAQQAARRQMELVQGVPFREIYAAHNSSLADDGGLSVAAPGATFDVPGLDPAPGDVVCGEIQFPTVLVGGDLQLREDVLDAGLGLPRDLDGSGAIDALDHSGDYRLLPIRVRVRWRGVSGVRTLDMETVLCER